VGRESAVGERGVGVRHGSNMADEYDDSFAASPLSHVDVRYLPFFLFTLPAGVLADMFNRRKLLCFMNLGLAMVAAGLAIANWLGLANPYLILGTVFLLGIGFAFNAPAWTAIIPEVVTKEDLPSAITLGGLQINISGIVGPAIGG
jgi:MFS family permease